VARSIQSYLERQRAVADAENDLQRNHELLGRPKQDAGTADAKAQDAAAISMQDNTGQLTTPQDTTPGQQGVTVTGSRTLQRRSEQDVQGTSSRLQRLEDRIRSGPLAPVAAAAGVAAGAEIPVTDNVSVSTDGVRGRWRW
jgi:hypothetical protein